VQCPIWLFFCSSLTSCLSGMLLTYFLNDFEIVPVAPIIIIIVIIIIVIIKIRGRVQTWAFSRTGIHKCWWCCCKHRSVWFATRADPSCCRFSSAHRRMLGYAARASLDVFLCAVQSSSGAVTRATSIDQERRTAGGSERTASSPECGRLVRT